MNWRTINVELISEQMTLLTCDNILSKFFHKKLADSVTVDVPGISLVLLPYSLLRQKIEVSSSIVHFWLFSSFSTNPNAAFLNLGSLLVYFAAILFIS